MGRLCIYAGLVVVCLATWWVGTSLYRGWKMTPSLQKHAVTIKASTDFDTLHAWAGQIDTDLAPHVPDGENYLTSQDVPEFVKRIRPPAAPWVILVFSTNFVTNRCVA